MEVETQTISNNFDFSNEQFSSFPYGRIHQCSSASQLSLAPSTWEANDGLILDDKYPSSMDVNENALDQVTEESMLVDTDEAITTDGSRPSVKSMEDINGLDDTHSLEESSTDKAALKLQKVYRSYRTRRRLADSAVVAEELWWQAINYARLNHSTISFFNSPETVAERWARVKLNASVVGKGLSKEAKAKKLAFQHWIEAIDPRHRYGHNLHFYYEKWCVADAGQPFFYWLDIGEGRDVDLKECPRSKLRQQCIMYLGPERELYEYIIVEGKIVHKQTGQLMDTMKGCQGAKWIFVMSAFKKIYAGEKKKGLFHHSSFLAGGATLAAGRLVAVDGVLKCISAYSGHYQPTGENLNSFSDFLKENGVNLNEVEIRSSTEDYDNYGGIKTSTRGISNGTSAEKCKPPHPKLTQLEIPSEVEKAQAFRAIVVTQTENGCNHHRTLSGGLQSPRAEVPRKAIHKRMNSKVTSSYQLGHQVSLKWTTGTGARIGCIADYPLELRVQALEFVKLSPRNPPSQSDSQQLATSLVSAKSL